jgi:hypothetical protein
MTKAGNQVRGLDPPHAPPQPALDTTIIVSAGEGGWWAWEDLNLRLHPYQLNAGNRCADRPFSRSRSTVAAKGRRSIRALVCVLLRLLEVIHELAIVAWRHLTFGSAPPLTCSLVFLAPGGCSSCDVRRAASCYGVRMSARRRRPRNARALTVPSGISRYVAICDWV